MPESLPTSILLVEDDLMVRKMLMDVLKTLGYHVLEAIDGVNALEIARLPHQVKIDLLITDIAMPKMNGLELVRQFSPEFPEAKIIVMSGYTEDPTFNHVMSQHHAEFIAKPFLLQALKQKIEGILSVSAGT
jgi:CheY-like chemotaxis protein